MSFVRFAVVLQVCCSFVASTKVGRCIAISFLGDVWREELMLCERAVYRFGDTCTTEMLFFHKARTMSAFSRSCRSWPILSYPIPSWTTLKRLDVWIETNAGRFAVFTSFMLGVLKLYYKCWDEQL